MECHKALLDIIKSYYRKSHKPSISEHKISLQLSDDSTFLPSAHKDSYFRKSGIILSSIRALVSVQDPNKHPPHTHLAAPYIPSTKGSIIFLPAWS